MTNVAQRSFAGGEIAPALYARTDVQKYGTALRACRNFVVQRHGGVANRPGFLFSAEVKDSADVARLIPFVFNDEQTYMLEFGDGYVRFHRDGAPLEVLAAGPWHFLTDYVVGDLVSNSGIVYYAIVDSTGQAPPNASFWYPFPGTMPGVLYEMPTPYAAADLRRLQFIQDADVLTLVHPDYAPRELRREADTRWILAEAAFGPTIDAPENLAVNGTGGTTDNYHWAVTAIDRDTLDESEIDPATGSGTLDNGAGPTDDSTPYTLTWDPVPNALEYRVYRYRDAVGPPYGLVGVVDSEEFVDLGNDTPVDLTQRPPLAVRPFADAGNFPGVVGFFQGRQLYAATENRPETVWGSRVESRGNFSPSTPLQPDDTLSFTARGRQVNEVRHLLDLERLLVFTADAELVALGDEAGVLRPGSPNLRKYSYHGSAIYPPPVVVGNNALYVQARRTIVRSFINDAVEGSRGADLTVYAAHLFDGYTIVAWAYQEIPHSVVWAVRSDGVLLGLTYMPEQAVWGWHRHDTDGLFEDVAVIPEGPEDRVYVIVRRTIDGNSVRFVERMASRVFTDAEDGVFMDAAVTYDGVAATVITGLAHLEGESVAVLADGAVIASPNNPSYPAVTVEGGQITLDTAASKVHVGLPFLSDIETLDIDTPSGRSLKEGKFNVSRVGLFVEASRGIWAGRMSPDDNPRNVSGAPNEGTAIFGLQEAKMRLDELLGEPNALRTGFVDINVETNWDSHGRVFVRQVDPVPVTILSATPQGFFPGSA